MIPTLSDATKFFREDAKPISNPVAPKHLIPFDKSLQKELNRRGIVDLTAVLWEKHCRKEIDLNIPFCFGRDREIMKIGVLLSTVEMPSNLIISGQTGCGKTVLIYELARQILMQPEGKLFHGQHILLMTEESGKKAVKADNLRFLAEKIGKKAILVFDECHKNLTSELPNLTSFSELVSLDFDSLADKCKPLLAENRLSIIGLTDRLGRFLERDPARQRRFTVIQLEELSIEATIEVIQKKQFQEKYSQKFNRRIKIGEKTIRTAIYLSMGYYEKFSLPSKAYLILDPAVSWYLTMHPNAQTVPPEAIIDYMIEGLCYKREEVEETLNRMDDLAHSQIPPHEPLARYTTNMSSMARRGKLAPAWEREALIESMGVIFGQEEFNNVLLTAPPGAGKTRLAEGLAYAIQNGQLPRASKKEVLLVNWELAKQNLPQFLKSARKYKGKFILVIDEAHRLAGNDFDFRNNFPQIGNIGNMLADPFSAVHGAIGAASSGGGDLDELKEAMGRGELPSLLMTTNHEAAGLLGDPAFMRRVERKKLDYLNKEQIENILQKEMENLSARYEVEMFLSKEAGEAIYYLSKIYYRREFQPSASFKVLHGICVFAKENRINEITLSTVFEALASREGIEEGRIRSIYLQEKGADHPSSRRIPDDEALKRYSDDWTKEARMRPPLGYVGHEEAFHRMQRTLSRATCNNVLLIGKAGTGKTTLVRRLAELMASEDEAQIPPALRNKPLLALRFGELRENPRAFAEFVASAKAYGGQYVLFIDEIHLLLGNTGIPLVPNLSRELEELKPLLADGTITLIGATTEEDLRHVQLNQAVRRRFTAIEILPPSLDEAEMMVSRIQSQIETQLSERLGQQVHFTQGALKKAVELADREQLPASAISILELGAVVAQTANPYAQQLQITERSLRSEEPSYFERVEEPSPSFSDALRLYNLAHAMTQGGSPRHSSSGGFWASIGRSLLAFITWPFRRLASLFN